MYAIFKYIFLDSKFFVIFRFIMEILNENDCKFATCFVYILKNKTKRLDKLAVEVLDLHVLCLRGVRVIESVSTISASMNSWFVKVDVYFRMSKSWMSSITEDNSLIPAILWRALINKMHCYIWIDAFLRNIKSLKTIIRLIPRLSGVSHLVELCIVFGNLIRSWWLCCNCRRSSDGKRSA